jgi:large subunit ribosomal protein L22
VSEIRGRPATDAVTVLRFMTRAVARDVEKVLNSAIANAESHPTDSYAADQLYVSAAYVGSGPTLKRWRARARGRVGRIKKRTCHITIRLAPIEVAQRPRAAEEAERPKRARRTRAKQPAAAEVTAAAAVTEPAVPETEEVEAQAPAEETKPARAPRKTAAAAEPAAEKPKRPRARKAPAAPEAQVSEPEAAEEPEKPKRAPRRKPSEPKEGES